MHQKSSYLENHPIKQDLTSSTSKFNAYKLKRNYFSNERQNDENNQYVYQVVKKNDKENQQIQENLGKNQMQLRNNEEQKEDIEIDIEFLDEEGGQDLADKNQNKNVQKDGQSIQSEEDLTQLWNMAAKQQKKCIDRIEKNNINEKIKDQSSKNTLNLPQNTQKAQIKVLTNQTDSSCQFTQEQLKDLLKNSQKQIKNDKEQNSNSNSSGVSRHQNRSHCIYLNEQSDDMEQKQDWDIWTQICEQLRGKNQFEFDGMKGQDICLTNIEYKTQNENDEQGFVIIDNHQPLYSELNSFPSIQHSQTVSQNGKGYKSMRKYGPWKYSTEIYELHYNCHLQFVQQKFLNIKSSNQVEKSQQKLIYDAEKPLRKINWQIFEEKRTQIKSLGSKKYCRTAVLQHGKDFLIFDHYKFIYSPLREGIHLYLGIKSFGDFSQINESESGTTKQIAAEIPAKDYLYLPSNGQCLLQTSYEDTEIYDFPNNVDKFDIYLSLTKEKVAVCERFISNRERDRRQCIQIRAYDSFERAEAEYLGIIQTKISKFNEQWYCDTIIYIPKKKIYSRKTNEKNWDKLKMHLKISEMGIIVAQLGIFNAKSSVTNCILFNENKTSQLMMGTIQESVQQINYIVRIEGISPILAFATVICRKLFVSSS